MKCDWGEVAIKTGHRHRGENSEFLTLWQIEKSGFCGFLWHFWFRAWWVIPRLLLAFLIQSQQIKSESESESELESKRGEERRIESIGNKWNF